MAKIRDGRQAKFYWIENRVLLDYGSRMGMAGIAVYNVLAYHADERRRSFPSYATIRRYTGMSRKTIAGALKTLVELGLLKIRRRLRGRQRQCNVYTLVDPPERAPSPAGQGGAGGSQAEPRGSQGGPPNGRFRGSQAELGGSHAERELHLPNQTTASAGAKSDERAVETPGPAAAAAAPETPPNPDGPATTSPGASGAAAAELQARGLPAGLAQRFASCTEPGLLQEAIAFYDGRPQPFTNPAGALRSMLEHPETWGFARMAAGWKRPSCEGDRPGRPDVDPLVAAMERARRDRAARRDLYGPSPASREPVRSVGG